MKAKKIIEVLNEWSKSMPPEYKLNQYEKWRKWQEEIDPNMESSFHNRYRVVKSVEQKGYYDLQLTKRWDFNTTKMFVSSLQGHGINIKFLDKINTIRIYNISKDADITETIIDLIEEFDPIGESYDDYYKPKISNN